MVQFRYAALCILTICDTCSVLYYNFKLGIFKMKSVLIKGTMKEIKGNIISTVLVANYSLIWRENKISHWKPSTKLL